MPSFDGHQQKYKSNHTLKQMKKSITKENEKVLYSMMSVISASKATTRIFLLWGGNEEIVCEIRLKVDKKR